MKKQLLFMCALCLSVAQAWAQPALPVQGNGTPQWQVASHAGQRVETLLETNTLRPIPLARAGEGVRPLAPPAPPAPLYKAATRAAGDDALPLVVVTASTTLPTTLEQWAQGTFNVRLRNTSDAAFAGDITWRMITSDGSMISGLGDEVPCTVPAGEEATVSLPYVINVPAGAHKFCYCIRTEDAELGILYTPIPFDDGTGELDVEVIATAPSLSVAWSEDAFPMTLPGFSAVLGIFSNFCRTRHPMP